VSFNLFHFTVNVLMISTVLIKYERVLKKKHFEKLFTNCFQRLEISLLEMQNN